MLDLFFFLFNLVLFVHTQYILRSISICYPNFLFLFYSLLIQHHTPQSKYSHDSV